MDLFDDRDQILKGMFKYICNLPAGSKTSVGQMIQELFPNESVFWEEEGWVYGVLLTYLEQYAEVMDLYLDDSKYRSEEFIHPKDRFFDVYKKKSDIACPFCGGKDTANVVYGCSDVSDELQIDLDNHRITLGGSCKTISSPEYYCYTCDTSFGRQALMLSEMGIIPYEDEIIEIELSRNAGLCDWNTIIIRKEGEDHYSITISSEVDSITMGFSPNEWKPLIKRMCDSLYVHEWKNSDRFRYRGIYDGRDEYLQIKFKGEGVRKSYSWVYWRKLLNIFDDIAKKYQNLRFQKMYDSIIAENAKARKTCIDDAGLSVRTCACLRRAGIETMGDLEKLSVNDMMKIRNLGCRSMEEAVGKMNEMGLRPLDENVKARKTRIEDAGFSVRVYNCLYLAGIRTMGDLEKLSVDDMMKIRLLARKGIQEVTEKLNEMGLRSSQ